MSLINDMLRDLDSQRTHPNAAHASALRGLGLAGPSGKPRDYTAMALYSCGLVLAMILALPWVMQLVKQPAANRTTALAIPEQAAPAARVKPVMPAGKDMAKTPVEVAAIQETPAIGVAAPVVNSTGSQPRPEDKQSNSVAAHTETAAAQEEPAQPPYASGVQATEHQIAISERPLTHEQQQQHIYRDGVAAVRTGNYPEAVRQLQQVLALNSSHHQARLMLANIYLRQQQHAEAETLLATGLAQDARHAPFAKLYAQLLIAQTRDQEAIQSLQTALPNAGQDAEFHALLAALYQRTGKPAAAVRLYETALHYAPVKAEWWMGLGISQEQSGNLPGAFAAYQRALQYPLKPVLQQYIQTRLKILSH